MGGVCYRWGRIRAGSGTVGARCIWGWVRVRSSKGGVRYGWGRVRVGSGTGWLKVKARLRVGSGKGRVEYGWGCMGVGLGNGGFLYGWGTTCNWYLKNSVVTCYVVNSIKKVRYVYVFTTHSTSFGDTIIPSSTRCLCTCCHHRLMEIHQASGLGWTSARPTATP